MLHLISHRPAALLPLALVSTLGLAGNATAQDDTAGSAFPNNRITQNMITSGQLPLDVIRTHGLRMFATPFLKEHGFGDGPMNPADPTSPGGRPTLQNNGTFLRVNGLDAQTCMECHSVLSNRTVPFTFGIAGVGGSNNNAMALPTDIDVDDSRGNGFAAFNGRYINPPFLYGAGGIELAGKEMTADLQALKASALAQPGTTVLLVTKGISFGSIRYVNGAFDTSNVHGVDDDLVVRPFGRKGEFQTTRAFDVEAMQFHFGMQPVEVVGNTDGDNDGIIDEVLVGELSALSIFGTTLERPRQRPSFQANLGRQVFQNMGCAECHVPTLHTTTKNLVYSFPEVPEQPFANPYYVVDLRQAAPRFRPSPAGGIRVECFSDLKRHDMGTALAETTGGELDSEFITARLWGVADTAPYLHDGRALTLREAILMHGGEAQPARNAFANAAPAQQRLVIKFLESLRVPKKPARGLDVNNL